MSSSSRPTPRLTVSDGSVASCAIANKQSTRLQLGDVPSNSPPPRKRVSKPAKTWGSNVRKISITSSKETLKITSNARNTRKRRGLPDSWNNDRLLTNSTEHHHFPHSKCDLRGFKSNLDKYYSKLYPPFTPPTTPQIIEAVSPTIIESVLTTLRKSENNVIGFDMEWNFQHYGESSKVALIQVGDLKTVLLIPIWRIPQFPQCLRDFLQDPSIKKVGVNIIGDARKLRKDYQVSLKGSIELSVVAKAVDSERWRTKRGLISLQTLTAYYCDAYLSKGQVRTSNWRQDLDEEQRKYSANDVLSAVLIWRRLMALEEIRTWDGGPPCDPRTWVNDSWDNPPSPPVDSKSAEILPIDLDDDRLNDSPNLTRRPTPINLDPSDEEV